MIRQEISQALKLDNKATIGGTEQLPSCFAVTELAANSIASVGLSIVQLLEGLNLVNRSPSCSVDQRLASLWFDQSIRPIDWEMPPLWDAIAGDYQAKDGWIKLHTNLPHHRDAALSVLKCEASRSGVAKVVKSWSANALEDNIVNAGGVAAAMRSREVWAKHPQGIAIKNEPLIGWSGNRKGQIKNWQP
ncbi:MAG: hypothetical protein L3J46_09660, partial [Kangiellaceae bacterium]|nr:hypothetical protein [Kangiellaceae bacterium]